MVSFSGVKNYLTKKAEDLKKAVMGEDESKPNTPAKKTPSTANVPLVREEALKQDEDMGLSVQKSKATSQAQTKEPAKQNEAVTPKAQTKPATESKTKEASADNENVKTLRKSGSAVAKATEKSMQLTLKDMRVVKAGQ